MVDVPLPYLISRGSPCYSDGGRESTLLRIFCPLICRDITCLVSGMTHGKKGYSVSLCQMELLTYLMMHGSLHGFKMAVYPSWAKALPVPLDHVLGIMKISTTEKCKADAFLSLEIGAWNRRSYHRLSHRKFRPAPLDARRRRSTSNGARWGRSPVVTRGGDHLKPWWLQIMPRLEWSAINDKTFHMFRHDISSEVINWYQLI